MNASFAGEYLHTVNITNQVRLRDPRAALGFLTSPQRNAVGSERETAEGCNLSWIRGRDIEPGGSVTLLLDLAGFDRPIGDSFVGVSGQLGAPRVLPGRELNT
jgi:hypothetical protein